MKKYTLTMKDKKKPVIVIIAEEMEEVKYGRMFTYGRIIPARCEYCFYSSIPHFKDDGVELTRKLVDKFDADKVKSICTELDVKEKLTLNGLHQEIKFLYSMIQALDNKSGHKRHNEEPRGGMDKEEPEEEKKDNPYPESFYIGTACGGGEPKRKKFLGIF